MTKWKGVAASFAPHVARMVSVSARRLLPAALLFGLATAPSAAQTLYWDGGTVNGGNPRRTPMAAPARGTTR